MYTGYIRTHIGLCLGFKGIMSKYVEQVASVFQLKPPSEKFDSSVHVSILNFISVLEWTMTQILRRQLFCVQ